MRFNKSIVLFNTFCTTLKWYEANGLADAKRLKVLGLGARSSWGSAVAYQYTYKPDKASKVAWATLQPNRGDHQIQVAKKIEAS